MEGLFFMNFSNLSKQTMWSHMLNALNLEWKQEFWHVWILSLLLIGNGWVKLMNKEKRKNSHSGSTHTVLPTA